MPYDTAVTAPPIGSSRSLDWYDNPDGTGFQQALFRGRIVGTTDQSSTSSNLDSAGGGMALTNAYIRIPVQVQGGWMRATNVQGSMSFNPVIALSTFQPTAKEVGWPIGRYVWEGIFHWPADPGAGVDSGLLLSPLAHARVQGAPANIGVVLGNRAGVIGLFSRGVGGFDFVDCSALAGPTNSLNKLSLVVRQPGFNRPASLTALVNDRVAVTRAWAGAAHHLPLPDSALAALFPQVVHASVGTACLVAELRYSSGPDVENL